MSRVRSLLLPSPSPVDQTQDIGLCCYSRYQLSCFTSPLFLFISLKCQKKTYANGPTLANQSITIIK